MKMNLLHLQVLYMIVHAQYMHIVDTQMYSTLHSCTKQVVLFSAKKKHP